MADAADSERDPSKRWQRRESRLRAARERLKKHGRSLQRVYVDAVRKRLRKKS